MRYNRRRVRGARVGSRTQSAARDQGRAGPRPRAPLLILLIGRGARPD